MSNHTIKDCLTTKTLDVVLYKRKNTHVLRSSLPPYLGFLQLRAQLLRNPSLQSSSSRSHGKPNLHRLHFYSASVLSIFFRVVSLLV